MLFKLRHVILNKIDLSRHNIQVRNFMYLLSKDPSTPTECCIYYSQEWTRNSSTLMHSNFTQSKLFMGNKFELFQKLKFNSDLGRVFNLYYCKCSDLGIDCSITTPNYYLFSNTFLSAYKSIVICVFHQNKEMVS